MRYVRIFFLHFQDAIDAKSRMLVWFFISLINPLIYLLFWRGASTDTILTNWTMPTMVSYYILLMIAGALLQVHIEENIAYYDIQLGYLANYLIKPVSYIRYKFLQELPYRLIEGSFGLCVLLILVFGFHVSFQIIHSPQVILLSIIIICLAYFISFLFKMILGISALWTTDFTGLAQLIGVVILSFGGFIVPIHLFPDYLQKIVTLTPFPYIFYYPITSVLGYYQITMLTKIILIQILWIITFIILYRILWLKGVNKFTAVGR